MLLECSDGETVHPLPARISLFEGSPGAVTPNCCVEEKVWWRPLLVLVGADFGFAHGSERQLGECLNRWLSQWLEEGQGWKK